MAEIEIYVGQAVEHGSDQAALARVVEALNRAKRSAIIFANVELRSRQIDLIVALPELTLVIEAKGNHTAVRGGESGKWEVYAAFGRWKPARNFRQQAIGASHAVKDSMAAFSDREDGYPVTALVFAPSIPYGSDLPPSDLKVSICSLAELDGLLARSSGLRWPLVTWRAFARQLNLTKVPDT